MSELPQTDIYNKVLGLGLPVESLIVVGSSAVEAALGPGVRRGSDVDIAVTEDGYRELRNNRSDLREIVEPDGYRHLVGDEGLDISQGWKFSGWKGKTVEELQRGGYEQGGIYVAGLPDVYEHKQRRGMAKDIGDCALIRAKLYDGSSLLPPKMYQEDLDFVRRYLPEHLHGCPQEQAGAYGLYVVRTVFGHEDKGVRTYSGDVETAAVPANYHAWMHSAHGGRDGQLNMAQANAERRARGLAPLFSDQERKDALSYYIHDAILGHGRRAANPERHDEKQTAEFGVRVLQAAGETDEQRLGGFYAGVITTTYNEETNAQDIDPRRGHVAVQEVNSGSDMAGFRRSDGPRNAKRLAIEDLCRDGAGFDRPLVRLMDEINANLPEGAPRVMISAVEDGLRLIQEHPDFEVTKAGNPPTKMTLLQAYAGSIRGSANFCANYKFPKRWFLGSEDRQRRNAEHLRQSAEDVASGQASPLDDYQSSEDYHQREQQAVSNERQNVNTGGGSLGELRESIATVLGMLPQEGVTQLSQRLNSVLELLAGILGSSENVNMASAQSLIAEANDLLGQAKERLDDAEQKINQFQTSAGIATDN